MKKIFLAFSLLAALTVAQPAQAGIVSSLLYWCTRHTVRMSAQCATPIAIHYMTPSVAKIIWNKFNIEPWIAVTIAGVALTYITRPIVESVIDTILPA